MKQTILNETELKFRLVEIYQEEQIKLIKERWNNLLPYEKKFSYVVGARKDLTTIPRYRTVKTRVATWDMRLG